MMRTKDWQKIAEHLHRVRPQPLTLLNRADTNELLNEERMHVWRLCVVSVADALELLATYPPFSRARWLKDVYKE